MFVNVLCDHNRANRGDEKKQDGNRLYSKIPGRQLCKSSSLPLPDPLSPASTSPSSFDEGMHELPPGTHINGSTHSRTLSLKDRISASLKNLKISTSNRDLRDNGDGMSPSARMVVFNDMDHSDDTDSPSTEEKEDELHEDPVIAEYRRLNAEDLRAKKVELVKAYRAISYQLWVKYVRVGAEFEINIDYSTRKRFAKMMGNKERWMENDSFNEKELFVLFRPCIQRMFTFLSNSFTRFKDKPDFDRIEAFLYI